METFTASEPFLNVFVLYQRIYMCCNLEMYLVKYAVYFYKNRQN